MSNLLCPDCNTSEFKARKFKKFQCLVCGWKGKDLLSKILPKGLQTKMEAETQKFLEMREKGKLTFVKLQLEKGKKLGKESTKQLMKLYDLHFLKNSDLAIFFTIGKFSEDKIKEIKSINGVKKVITY